jgi:hypothetical protein
MIGFQVNELDEVDWSWLAQGLRELIEIFEEMEESPEVLKALAEIRKALFKVENRVED